MAKTYYNYAERDVNSMIDWSQVGKNLTDMLTEQASLRQSKRQALEQASNDFGKVVSDTPTGLSESWNNRTLDFASNVQEQRKLDDSLLAQGLMPLNMYLKKRELSKMGTEKFYGISKKMQAEFASSLDRMKQGKSMEREQLNMELIENLASNGMPMLHDVTGELIIAGMIDGPDGVKVIDPNKNNHMTVDDYDRLVTQKFDKYDFSSAANAAADLLGDYVIANVDEATRAGGLSVIIEKSGAGVRDDINRYVDDFVNTIKANPLHMESVLTDTMGKYKTTYDTDQAASDPNYILLVKDGKTGVAKAEFTDAQQKDFEDFAKRQLSARLDEKLKITSAGTKPFDPTRSLWINRLFEKQDKAQQFSLIASARRGDKTAWQTLITNYDVSDFGFDPEKPFMSVTRGGQVKPISLEGDAITSGANIAAALGLNPQEYIEWAKENNVVTDAVPSKTLKTNFIDIRGVKEVPKLVDEPQQQAFIRIQSGKIKGKIDPENTRNSRANLQATLGSIPGMESIKVGSADSGKTITINDAEGGELLRITPSEATPTQIANFENSLAQLSYNRTLGVKDGVKIIEQITQGQLGKVVEGGIRSGDSIFEQ